MHIIHTSNINITKDCIEFRIYLMTKGKKVTTMRYTEKSSKFRKYYRTYFLVSMSNVTYFTPRKANHRNQLVFRFKNVQAKRIDSKRYI